MHIPELSRFLLELSENNNRAWFVMNKPRYDILRTEFLAFVSQLINGISQFDSSISLTQGCDPKKALFRINRDVRFGADKSPYKTNFSASILPSGRKKPSDGGGPAYYCQMGADNRLFFAVGEYMPPADRLHAIRMHIANEPKLFAKLLRNKTLIEHFGSLQTEGALIRPPKGFDKDDPHIEFLKLKSFIVWSECPLMGLYHDEALNIFINNFKYAFPLVHWLRSSHA